MALEIAGEGASARVWERGGMVTAAFALQERMIEPLHTPAWDRPPTDPLLAGLRGDFLCAPFGIAPPSQALPPSWSGAEAGVTAHGHGYPAQAVWQVDQVTTDRIRLRVRYPAGHDLGEAVREVSIVGGSVLIEDALTARRSVALPLGLHPMVRLPQRPGSVSVQLPRVREYRTYPVPVDASSILAPDTVFNDLAQAPLARGGTIDLTRIPLGVDTEELVLACEPERGVVEVDNHEEGYRFRLEWDASTLAHCLLWFSNRGRQQEPWSGRHRCLGVEPVTSAFDLGPQLSTSSTPLSRAGLATAVPLTADHPLVLRHQLSLRGLGP